MKKSLLWLILTLALALGALGCTDASPLSGIDVTPQEQNEDDIDISDAWNNELNDGPYLLLNQGAKRLSLGYNSSAAVSLKLTTMSGAVVANTKILLQLEMDSARTASLSNSGAKYSDVVTTNAKGIASANVYSAAKEAQGILTASVKGKDGAEVDCNSVQIKIVVHDENGTDPNDQPTVIDDDPPDPAKGNVQVTVQNIDSPARKTEINVYAIDASDSTDYCTGILDGTMNVFSESKIVTLSTMYSTSGNPEATAVFRTIEPGKKVVVFAYGLDAAENEIGNADCKTTGAVASGQTERVELTLNKVPEKMPELDQSYDTLLHLNLSNAMPDSWKKWFNLIDGLLATPVGTGIYYALYAWEYRSGYANGGGSNIDLKVVTLNVWDTVIRGDLDHDPTVSELMINCGLKSGAKTGACPEFKINALVFSVGPYEVFPLAVNAAEDYLDSLGGFGDIYQKVKTVGSDIMNVAKSFDIGARFDVAKTSETTVNVTEAWTHVVYTWRLNDESEECQSSDASERAKCGRHAFPLVTTSDLTRSFVYQQYEADIEGPFEGVVTLKLPAEHSFPLKYGALIRILINNLAVPLIIENTGSVDADGDYVEVNGNSNLGTLLNYVIPCYHISEAVHDWVVEKTSSWEFNLFGMNVNIGQLIDGFISTEQLNGYCEDGITAGSNELLKLLDKLIVDPNIKVRPNSKFELTDVKNSVPQKLENLEYLVGISAKNTNEDGWVISETEYNAKITGEGILAEEAPALPDSMQCADFLILSDDAARVCDRY